MISSVARSRRWPGARCTLCVRHVRWPATTDVQLGRQGVAVSQRQQHWQGGSQHRCVARSAARHEVNRTAAGLSKGPASRGVQRQRGQEQWRPRPACRNVLVEHPTRTRPLPQDLLRVPRDLLRVPRDFRRVPRDLQRVPRDLQCVPRDLQRVPRDLQRVPRDLQRVLRPRS